MHPTFSSANTVLLFNNDAYAPKVGDDISIVLSSDKQIGQGATAQTVAACPGPQQVGGQIATGSTCTGGTCSCGTIDKKITALQHLFVVQVERAGTMLKMAERYCAVQQARSIYIMVYASHDGDAKIPTYTIFEVEKSFEDSVKEVCSEQMHYLKMDIYIGSDVEEGAKIVRDTLLKYSSITGVITMTTAGAAAAVAAISSATGRSMSDITVITLGYDDISKGLLTTHQLAGAVDMGYAMVDAGVASSTMALIEQVFVDGSVPSDGVMVRTQPFMVVPDFASWLTSRRLVTSDLKARPIDPTIPITESRASVVGVSLLMQYYTVSVKVRSVSLFLSVRLKLTLHTLFLSLFLRPRNSV
jgi:hypothetical protein